MSNSDLPPLLSARETAMALGLSRKALYERLGRGTLPIQPLRFGTAKNAAMRFRRGDVEELLGISA